MKQNFRKSSSRSRWWIPSLLLSVLAAAVIVMGNTYAWFAISDTVTNTLKTKDMPFSFEIVEKFVPKETVVPGAPVEKIVDVKNTGEIPGFVRVLVLVEIIAEDGTVLEAVPGVTFTFDGLNTTDWTPGNTKKWADGEDGYFYYLDRLEAGETTSQPLFSAVTLATGLDDEYYLAHMKIEVKLEASETIRAKYRDGWWKNGDIPPGPTPLRHIDDTLAALAQ